MKYCKISQISTLLNIYNKKTDEADNTHYPTSKAHRISAKRYKKIPRIYRESFSTYIMGKTAYLISIMHILQPTLLLRKFDR